MLIERVILASNISKDYLSFWPLVAYGWKRAGFIPTLFFIGEEKEFPFDHIEGTEVYYRQAPPGIHPGEYARMIRLYLPILFPGEVSLISDMDMIPIKPQFFAQKVAKIPDDHIALETCGVYLKEPWRYPMCYYIAKGNTFAEILRFRYEGLDQESCLARFDQRIIKMFNKLWDWRGKIDEYVFSILHAKWSGRKKRTVKHHRGFKLVRINARKNCPWVPTRLVLGKKGIWSKIDPRLVERRKYIEIVVKAPPERYIQEGSEILKGIGWDLQERPFLVKGRAIPPYEPSAIEKEANKPSPRITKDMVNRVLEII